MYSPATFGQISSLIRRSSYDKLCFGRAPKRIYMLLFKTNPINNVSFSIRTHTVEHFSNAERKTLIIIAYKQLHVCCNNAFV